MFNNKINNVDWAQVHNSNNADDKYNTFFKIYETCYNESFPKQIKTENKRKATGKQWILPWLQEACDRKNKLYHIYIKKPTLENKNIYINFKKWVEKRVYVAKRKYYNNLINMYSSNSKKQWQIMNNIINRKKSKNKINKLKIDGVETSNNVAMAEAFNTYFSNIANELKNNINLPTNSLHTLLPENSTKNSIFLIPTTSSEVSDLIKSLNNSTTSDLNITALKSVNFNVSEILSHTINASLQQGTFPAALKVAKVIPIHKTGKKDDVSNYRPISLLSVFSKLYEKVMQKRLLNFFEKNNSIYKGQYGFRPRHSCEHALLDAQNYLLHTLDKKEIALLLLIDFSKAFDMVDHEILLNKLYFYGVRGLAHDWLRSYLFDRSQYVSINGKKSSTRKLEFGVPQGSILGPLLFVIYINDMPNINKSIHFILYADDANIIVTGKTLQIIQKQIQKFIPHLLNWINTNALKLNIDKTKYI